MENYFDITQKHNITSASSNNYIIPALHPTRILPEHDLIYMLDGEWKIGQENEEFTAQKGDVLILAANRQHYGIEPCSAGSKTLYIHAAYAAGDEFDETGNKIVLQSLIKTNANPNVKNCFEKIIYAKSCGNLTKASAYFDVLLCELRDCMGEMSKNTIAESIRQMIISSDKILKNTEIAKSLNISVKTAENTFKSAFQTTIHQYIIDTKIEHAKFYLINFPDMKLYEISANLGFYDEFHLSRQFKKVVGLSPGEYKKQKILSN